LPDPELRKAYRTWLSREETRLIRASFDPLVEYRLVPKSTTSFGPRDVDAIVDHFAQVFFPGPFQPFDSAFTQIALCATFEQEWRALARRMAALAPGATRAVKSVIGAAVPSSHPELEEGATDAFARLWTADAHWAAVEALEQKRKTE